MNYEYNGNLLENERILLVASEIINKYPKVNFEKAKDAAMLEGRISQNKTKIDELNRLYNIMLVNSNDKLIVATIFKDYLEILRINPDNLNNKYYYIAGNINYYLNDKIDEFPFINEFE